jgi:hypothetical protein
MEISRTAPSLQYLRKLYQGLVELFSTDELKTLCFSIGIDFERIAGEQKDAKARELIEFLKRRGRLEELVEYCSINRPNFSWIDTEFPQGYQPQMRYTLVYSSQTENEPFASWTTFSSVRGIFSRIQLTQRTEDGFVAYELRAFGDESVGVNKSLRILRGRVDFDYKVLESNVQAPNILFYIIPMQETGIGRSGLIEVGTDIQDDPRNARSPYRKSDFVPIKHYGDNQWHRKSLPFDFTDTPDAFYSIFGPRINEGSGHTGPASFLVANIQIFSSEQV